MTDSIVTTRDLKAISSARDVQGIATARLMKAVDVRLLASTLNSYFSDVQSMTESASIGFIRNLHFSDYQKKIRRKSEDNLTKIR